MRLNLQFFGENELPTGGKCGEAVFWRVETAEEKIVLTISGKGKTDVWRLTDRPPYYKYRDSVTDIVVEPGITVLGDSAFADFTAVLSVSLPESLEYLGVQVFSGCASIKSIKLPEGLRVIGPKAFEKLDSLEEIFLPSTLFSVDFKGFKDSDALKTVHYAGTAQQWGRKVRVSRSSCGNASLLKADFVYAETTRRYDEMTAKIAKLIADGGDGRFYIVTPDLTVEDFGGKSGDCALLVFPDGKTMMIDTGVGGVREHVMRLVRKTCLKNLDFLTISHPHADHIANALTVAEYLVGIGGGVGVYLNSGMQFKNQTTERELSAYLSAHGTEIRSRVHAGDVFNIGDVTVELFNPAKDSFTAKDAHELNDMSLAMRFTYGESSYFTSGDLYFTHEALLAEKYGERLRSDIVKTNHHCCYTSNSRLWIETLKPRMLISHCDDSLWTEFEEYLAKIKLTNLRVSDRGLVIVSMGKDRDYTVETEY